MSVCACENQNILDLKLLKEGGICPFCKELILGEILDVDSSEVPDNDLLLNETGHGNKPEVEVEIENILVVESSSEQTVKPSLEQDLVRDSVAGPEQSDEQAAESPVDVVEVNIVDSNELIQSLDTLSNESESNILSIDNKVADYGNDFEDDDPPTEHTEVNVGPINRQSSSLQVEEYTENFPSPYSLMDSKAAIPLETVDLSPKKSGFSALRIGFGLVCLTVVAVATVMMSQNKETNKAENDQEKVELNIVTPDLSQHPIEKEKAKVEDLPENTKKPKRSRTNKSRIKAPKNPKPETDSIRKNNMDMPVFKLGNRNLPSSLTSDNPKSNQNKSLHSLAKRKQGNFKLCVKRIQKNDPDFQGRWNVSFRVLKSGKTSSISVNPTNKNKSFESCLKSQIKKWTFPAQTSSEKLKLTVIAG